MKRALVSIGVNKIASDSFPALTGAVAGAKSIAQWGRNQGFDVKLFTDENGPVTKNDIFSAIQDFLDAAIYSQMVVYFSGHGLLPAPANEIWLLSGALKNPSEAIAVQLSIWNARNSRLAHVVFISDACRSMPKNFLLGGASPGPIFPDGDPPRVGPKIDVFYATRPGDPAYEVASNKTNTQFNGLLTDCMLSALDGTPSSVISCIQESRSSRYVVGSEKLQDHLQNAVPKAAQDASIVLTQYPQIIVESRLPLYLSDLTPEAPAAPSRKGKSGAGAGTSPPQLAVANHWSRWLTSDKKSELAESMRQSVDSLASIHVNALRKYSELPRPHNRIWHRQNFITKGLTLERIRYVDNREGEPIAALIEFKGGNGIYLPVFRDFIAVIVGEHSRVLTINYDLKEDYQYLSPYRRENIARGRALVATLAREGQFRIEPELAERTASVLRYHKRIDPILGMFAAYAYSQAGNFEEVLSVYRYMDMDPAPVLFDVGLLAAQVPRNYEEDGIYNLPPPEDLKFMPGMPLLTQGWLNLGRYESAMPDVLMRAREYLLPGLWTTFAPRGIAILAENLSLRTIYENSIRPRP